MSSLLVGFGRIISHAFKGFNGTAINSEIGEGSEPAVRQDVSLGPASVSGLLIADFSVGGVGQEYFS
jgi:hypothetical protein